MTVKTRPSSSNRARWASGCALISAILGASCLLTTSLDGLEGPPLSVDAGADSGASEGGLLDAAPDAGDVAADGADGPAITDAESDAVVIDARDADGPSDGPKVDDGDAIDGDANAPIAVAPTGDVVRGLAVYGADLYWVQGDPGAGIVRVSKAGGQPAFVQMTADAFDVAVDDVDVYWSTGTKNEVFHKPLGSTGSGTPLFSGAGETLYLAAGKAGLVYATGFDVVVVGPRDDGGTSLLHYASQPGSAGIARIGGDILWSTNAGIVHGTESGDRPQSVYSSAPGEIAGIASDGQEVFWMAPDGVVRALPLGNPAPPPAHEVCRASFDRGDADIDARPDGSDGSAVRDVAVDEQWVYFAEPARRRISKCIKHP